MSSRCSGVTSYIHEIGRFDLDLRAEGRDVCPPAKRACRRTIQHLFLMTGAAPRTEWLRGCVALDDKGFILTGRDLDTTSPHGASTWPLTRPPQMLETSLPGVFAVGDARSGNVKRVASAVGEGAISVHMVHQALAEL